MNNFSVFRSEDRIFQRFSVSAFQRICRMFPLILICWLWLSGGTLQAQIGSGGASCNDWSIEVCSQTPAMPTENDLGCAADGCSKVYYRFYLVNNSGTIPPGSDVPFSFTNFGLVCNLGATPSNITLVGSGRSKVNVANSVYCTPTDPGLSGGTTNNPISSCLGGGSCPLLSYDESARTVAYQVSSTSQGSGVVNWTVQRRFLFLVLAVDVYPGETISLNSFVANIVYAPSGISCNLPVDDTCAGTSSITLTNTMPSLCSSSAYRLRLSAPIDIPTSTNLNRKKVDMFMSGPAGGNMKINELVSLLVHTPGTTNLQNITIEEGLLKLSDLDIYSPSVFSTVRNILIDYRDSNGGLSVDFDQSGNSPIFFSVIYEGPMLASECASATLQIKGEYGRIQSDILTCCRPWVPFASANRTILFGNQTDCPELCPAVRFAVEKPANQLAGCTGRYFDVWADADVTTNLQDIRLVLDVKKSGTINFNVTNSLSICLNCLTSSVLPNGDIRLTLNLVAANPLIQVGTIASGGRKLIARLQFSGSAGVIHEVVVRDARILPNLATKSCVPAVSSQLTSLAADDIGFGSFMITAEAFKGPFVPSYNWTYFLNPKVTTTAPFYDPLCTDPTGSPIGDVNTVSPCACYLENQTQNVALYSDREPLNGVTTYDLVLIQRHILGSEPLSGYYLLSADANSSKNVNTFDIIELRKLILGINTSLPTSNSWRFIDKNINVNIPDQSQIFSLLGGGTSVYGVIPPHRSYFPGEFVPVNIPSSGNIDNIAEFVGYKIGDVNASFTADNEFNAIDDRTSAQFSLGIPPISLRKGRSIEIPVFSMSEASLIGWQMALQYDTNQVNVKGIRWAQEHVDGRMQDQAWYQPTPGELRMLWFDAEGSLSAKAGVPLFYIDIEAKIEIKNEGSLFRVFNSIPAECYNKADELYQISLELSSQKLVVPEVSKLMDAQASASVLLHVYPNPAGQFYRIEMNASVASIAQLTISDLTGKMISQREVALQPGVNIIQAQQLPELATGQYIIRLETSDFSSVTKFSKE